MNRKGFIPVISLFFLLAVVIVLVLLVVRIVDLRAVLHLPKAINLDDQEMVVQTGVTKKVQLLIFNPVIESEGGKKLNQLLGWNDPDQLTRQYIYDTNKVSGNSVNYQIVQRLEVDSIPHAADGFQYSDKTYLDCWRDHSKCHVKSDDTHMVDYRKILIDYDVCGKVNRGEIDELWLFGGPWFGYWEAVMAGPGAFNTNAGPISNTSCSKQLHIMGFSYERGVSEMLEDLGHRAEGTFTHVFGEEPRWNNKQLTSWGKFIAACGWMHYAPNSSGGYDWTNQRYVTSSCEDWLNYPNFTGTSQNFNCSPWGCDGYGYKKWWLSHIPKNAGKTDGKWNNWWWYIVDHDKATTLSTPIVAKIQTNPTSGLEPLRVSFSNLTSGGVPPITYVFDFGDGQSQTLTTPQTVEHIYKVIADNRQINDGDIIGKPNQKVFNITLTATDLFGQDSVATVSATVESTHKTCKNGACVTTSCRLLSAGPCLDSCGSDLNCNEELPPPPPNRVFPLLGID